MTTTPLSVRVIGYYQNVKGISQNMHAVVTALKNENNTTIDVLPVNQRIDITVKTDCIDFFCYHETNPQTLGNNQKAVLIAWELEIVPDVLLEMCRKYNHIFSVSRFTQSALALYGIQSTVLHIPPPPTYCHVSFSGIEKRDFIVLFIFDFASSIHRKNPQDAIMAFMMAFHGDPRQHRATFWLKTINANDYPYEKEQLEEFVDKFKDYVVWDDKVYTDDEMINLYRDCDVYVSLHRSEGYGLTLLYAMALGKPVVTTHYSGNLDFCNDNNCKLVPVLRMIPVPSIDQVYGGLAPLRAVWAQPDVAYAASCIRWLWEHPDQRKELGQRAHKSIMASHTLQNLGKVLKNSLVDT